MDFRGTLSAHTSHIQAGVTRNTDILRKKVDLKWRIVNALQLNQLNRTRLQTYRVQNENSPIVEPYGDWDVYYSKHKISINEVTIYSPIQAKSTCPWFVPTTLWLKRHLPSLMIPQYTTETNEKEMNKCYHKYSLGFVNLLFNIFSNG